MKIKLFFNRTKLTIPLKVFMMLLLLLTSIISFVIKNSFFGIAFLIYLSIYVKENVKTKWGKEEIVEVEKYEIN